MRRQAKRHQREMKRRRANAQKKRKKRNISVQPVRQPVRSTRPEGKNGLVLGGWKSHGSATPGGTKPKRQVTPQELKMVNQSKAEIMRHLDAVMQDLGSQLRYNKNTVWTIAKCHEQT